MAKRKRHYNGARILSTVAGLAIAGTSAGLGLAHTDAPDMQAVIVALACGAAFGAYMLPSLSGRLAALVVVGILAAEAYNFAAAIERILAVREERALAVRQNAEPRHIAQARVERAVQAVAEAERAEAAERSKGGCGKKCRDFELATAEARKRLETEEAKLAIVPVARSESRLASALGVQAVTIDGAMASVAQAAFLCLVLAFLGFAHGRKPAPKTKAASKRATKPRRKPKPPSPLRNSGTVIPFPKAVNDN